MIKKELVAYNIDASRIPGKVDNVFFPITIKDVINIVKSSNTDLVIRGNGTGIVGGSTPINSVLVDMSKMNKVTNFNPVARTVHVEAGITVKELNEKLDSVNHEFPIYFHGQEYHSIGGMIALNSPGDRSLKYGNIKDWVEEIEFINGNGELVKTTKADLMDVCGMEGLTGVIVGATLRVLGNTRRTASIYQSERLDETLSIARRLKSEREVVMIEFFSPIVSKILGLPERYHLIIEFDSDRGKISGIDYLTLINLRKKVYHTLIANGYYNVEDPKLFFDKTNDFVKFLEQKNIPYFGFIGSGIMFCYFKDEEKNKQQETYEYMLKNKFRIGVYGIGLKRKSFLDSFEQKVVQRVKLRYDNFLKFNNNKMIDIDPSLKRIENIKRAIKDKEEVLQDNVPENVQNDDKSDPVKHIEIPKAQSDKEIYDSNKIKKSHIIEIKEKYKNQESKLLDQESKDKRLHELNSDEERVKELDKFEKIIPKEINILKNEINQGYKKQESKTIEKYNITDIMTNKFKSTNNPSQIPKNYNIIDLMTNKFKPVINNNPVINDDNNEKSDVKNEISSMIDNDEKDLIDKILKKGMNDHNDEIKGDEK